MSQHNILAILVSQLQQQVVKQAQVIKLPAGQVFFNPGERCQGLPLLRSGAGPHQHALVA